MLLPPGTIDYSQFTQYYAKEGWKLIIIGPTSTWRADWGPWEAIRDFVQNALDETEAYSWSFDGEGLIIKDAGSGVAISDLLLGPPKIKAPGSRGQFGEGMKIASLALLRMGYRVYIETPKRLIIMLFMEQETDAGPVKSLAALWKPHPGTPGTKIHIVGYFGDSFDDRFVQNIPRLNILNRVRVKVPGVRSRENMIISSPTQSQRIYIKDIYMRDSHSLFSYNFWDVELAPDRFAPRHEAEIESAMAVTWSTVRNVEMMKALFEVCKSGNHYNYIETDRMYSGYPMDDIIPKTTRTYKGVLRSNAPLWVRAWNEVFGKNTVVSTALWATGPANHLGFDVFRMPNNLRSYLEGILKTDMMVIAENIKKVDASQLYPEGKLDERQKRCLALARKIVSLCSTYTAPPGVYAAIIPDSSSGHTIGGLYNRQLKRILIHIRSLKEPTTTVDTIIHELAHHTSQADDGTESHTAAISGVASRVVFIAANGQLKDELDQFSPSCFWIGGPS